MSILLSAEMEVEGDLKVTGTIQNDSLAQVIANLQAQITALQNQVIQLECINNGNIPAGDCDCFGNVLDVCGDCGGDAISEDECEINYTLSFDGWDDWVSIEGIDAFPKESGTIVFLYIGVSPNNQGENFITDCLNSNGMRHGFGKSSDNRLSAGEYLAGMPNENFLSDPIEWNEMQIYHIAYSWSAEGRKFYRDGDIIAETDIGSYQFYDDCGLIIGRGYYSIYNKFLNILENKYLIIC